MQKPENMTHLNATDLVEKTDMRIALRGALDSLHGEMLLLQAQCHEDGASDTAQELEPMSELVSKLVRGDADWTRLGEWAMLGHTLEEIRQVSHSAFHLAQVPQPAYCMGVRCAQLNLLRARIREVELLSAHVFAHFPTPEYKSTQYALNRLSSGVYVLFCRSLAQNEDEQAQPCV